jgi:hypothetical protein
LETTIHPTIHGREKKGKNKKHGKQKSQKKKFSKNNTSVKTIHLNGQSISEGITQTKFSSMWFTENY